MAFAYTIDDYLYIRNRSHIDIATLMYWWQPVFYVCWVEVVVNCLFRRIVISTVHSEKAASNGRVMRGLCISYEKWWSVIWELQVRHKPPTSTANICDLFPGDPTVASLKHLPKALLQAEAEAARASEAAARRVQKSRKSQADTHPMGLWMIIC